MLTALMTSRELCASLEWTTPDAITWHGFTGYVALDDERRATIRLTAPAVAEHYTCFNVDITSKLTGRIAQQTISFDDHLVPAQGSRVERNRLNNKPRFEIISYVKWGWYITQPATTRPLTEAIESYIELFK